MNKQEIFDKAVDLFKQMKERCVLDGQCKYFVLGNRCIVGRMIEMEDARKWHDMGVASVGYLIDDLNNPDESRFPRWFLEKTKAKYPWLVNPDNKDILIVLQETHDNSTNWDDNGFTGFADLAIIGRHRGLNTEKVEQYVG